MPAYAREQRIPDDERRWQSHLGYAAAATMQDPIKEHLHDSMTDLIGRLHDRGDARLKEIFRNQFVKCNEGDAVRSREAQRVQALQRAQTRNSVGGEQGCRLVLLTQQPTLADGMDVLHLKARRPNERRVHRQSGVFQCATVAAQALLLISQRQRARNDCDAAMPEREQMLDSEFRRAAVVHAHGIWYSSLPGDGPRRQPADPRRAPPHSQLTTCSPRL